VDLTSSLAEQAAAGAEQDCWRIVTRVACKCGGFAALISLQIGAGAAGIQSGFAHPDSREKL